MSGALSAHCQLRRRDFELDVTLSLEPGAAGVLLGASGAGKSTLLRAVAGLTRCRPGRVSFGDLSWQDEARGHFVPVERRRIGYVFQEDALFPHLTVHGNLELARRFVPAAERRIELARAIDVCGIGSWLGRKPADLSGGQRRRVALARALATSPRLLLLDEPFSGLDAAARQELSQGLLTLGREFGLSQLHTSHSLEDAVRVADQLFVLERGRLVDTGTAAEVLGRGTLRALFPEHHGWIFVHEAERHFVRQDQLLVSPDEPRASSAVWTVSVELLERRSTASEVALRCALGAQEFLLCQPRERVAEWQLEPGSRLWLQATNSLVLGPAEPQSQPMRLGPMATSSM